MPAFPHSHEGQQTTEARLRDALAVAHVGDFFWKLTPTSSVSWSDELYRIYGVEPGTPISLETYLLLVHVDDRERVRGIIEKSIRTGEPYHKEHRIVQPTGEVRWVTGDGRCVTDEHGTVVALQGTCHDITERKRIEEALNESRMRDRLLVESALEAIITMNDEGFIEDWNPQAQIIFGWLREEAVGKSLAELIIPPSLRVKHREGLLRFLSTGKARILNRHIEITALHRNGHEFPVELTVVPMREGGRFRFSGFLRDLTQRKRAEEENRQLEMRVQQSQKSESLGLLAGGIAHDFNNLLAAILGYAGLALKDMPVEQEARRHVREIELVALRASDLTRQLLAYSGRGRFVEETIDLCKLVHEMTQLLQTAVSKKAFIQFELDTALIEGDPTQIRQVLMNLLINASDALGDQSGLITLRTGVLDADRSMLHSPYLTADLPAGRYAFVQVTDTGCGMSAATLQRIFDPFFTTKFTGRGLGLAAVLGIVKGHRGTIQVASEENHGTTFKMLLPSSETSVAVVQQQLHVQDHWVGSGQVLVVDDEDSILNLLGYMLTDAGFSVLFAHDGKEAVEVFARQGKDIVAVILDLTMPRLDGIEVLRELRGLSSEVRVLLMSGYNDHDVIARFGKQTLGSFIQKPFRPGDFMVQLKQLLEK